MSDKLEALSQPVGYVGKNCRNSVASGNLGYIKPNDAFGESPVYSQEYVTALLAALEEARKNQRTKWDRCLDAEHTKMQALLSQAERREEHLKADTAVMGKRIAEFEQRLQQPALADVIAERQRQISAEGWTPEHDDEHENNELAFAAGCYAIYAGATKRRFPNGEYAPPEWPWNASFWRPSTARRDLVKAGALILAEIERLDRAPAKVEGE
ncbi:ead/Ea22-like family protein [Serratia fonticola]|uniref:ead/Ea22-like family protein n=1 Tax=Serratia fonticola TaxID=47917 RepID=UPI003AAE5D05